MLRDDVVDAVAQGRFAIHAVATVDELLALLTGISAGERGGEGHFPLGSVNWRVERRLTMFAERNHRVSLA